ncbi:MAG TPA: hypothetical protein VFM18_08675 [Methanosarcina sp.]|nr:hypothetical protein [Methanosarcina sp.]
MTMPDDDFEPSLPEAPEKLNEASLATIYKGLTRIFNGESWLAYEPETIALQTGVRFSNLLFDKVEVIRVLLTEPDVLDNASFILHATDVVNNVEADFEYVPLPTSLELAYYIKAVQDLLKEAGRPYTSTSALRTVAWYLLTEEGYSEPVPPFTFVDADSLKKGQTPGDTKAKKEAIEKYLAHMETL